MLLPPLLVEHDRQPPWRYVKTDRVEVLSRCSESATNEWVVQMHAMSERLEWLLPARFQYRSGRPMTAVLLSDSDQMKNTQQMLALMDERERVSRSGGEVAGRSHASSASFQMMPSFRFWDQDSEAIFFMWGPDHPWDFMFTPSYVRSLMERRTPALPRWFIEGMMKVYADVSMRTEEVSVVDLPHRLANPAPSPSGSRILLEPLTWISPEVTHQMNRSDLGRLVRKLNQLNVSPLPLRQVLTRQPESFSDPGERQIWRSTAGLFVRALLSDGLPFDALPKVPFDPKNVSAPLWNLLTKAGAEPVSEALFQECIGYDFKQADRWMESALLIQMTSQRSLTLPKKQVSPAFASVLATENEVSRLRGGLNRLEIAYLREVYPALVPHYLEQARGVLKKSYQAGDRDPRLLAEMGLCECDGGDEGAAQPLLEAAVAGRIDRPRVWYELARLRFRELRSSRGQQAITAEDVRPVQSLLTGLRGLTPPLTEAYELMIETWLISGARLSEADWDYLAEGLQAFPRRARLLRGAVIVHAAQGRLEAARSWLRRAMAEATDAAEQAALDKLRQSLEPGR